MESARALRKEARTLKEAGDLKGAAAKYKAAHALAHTAVTGAELAEAYVALGLLIEARNVAVSVVAMPVEADETSKSQDARTLAASLADSLDELHVTIDGEAVPEAAVLEAQRVNPGAHEIVARLGLGEPVNTSVTLKESEVLSVNVRVVAKPVTPGSLPAVNIQTPVTVAPPPDVESRGGLSPLVPIGGIVLGVGLVAGSLFGIRAISLKNTLDGGLCEAGKTACRPGYESDLSSAKTSGTISTVGFSIAGIGAGIAIVGLIVGKSANPSANVQRAAIRPWLNASLTAPSAGVSGAF
jgi:hypothetical protein